MTSTWESTSLGSLTTKIGSGATPRGGGSVYVSEGTAFIRSQNVLDNEFSTAGLAYIDDGAAHDLRGVTVQEGDVLLNITGDSILRCCSAPTGVLPARVSQHVAILRAGPALIPGFLQRLMVSPQIKDRMLSLSDGATRKAITKGQLESLTVQVPPLGEQRAIAEVLGALDDKIAANRKLAETADRLACSLVQQRLDRNESVVVSDIAAVTMGSSPPGDSYNEDGVGTVFYQGNRDFGFRSPTNRLWTTDPKRLAESGDTLMSVRAPVGQLNVATETTCIGRGLGALRSSDGTPSLLYYRLKVGPELWEPFESGGTVFGSINAKELNRLQIPRVSGDALELEAQVASLDSAVASAELENLSLGGLRDTLLPRLMSGELRVSDAERGVEEVV